jgi:hypothetical protein
MHQRFVGLSPMATVTAACPFCNRVFYVDTDDAQEWLARNAPGTRPGETVHYSCPEHLFLNFLLGPRLPTSVPPRRSSGVS